MTLASLACRVDSRGVLLPHVVLLLKQEIGPVHVPEPRLMVMYSIHGYGALEVCTIA
jgi:hypothetical protein